MHTFHIPVLGLGYSVDTPVKVAPLGISSVASIVDDELIERMRAHYSRLYQKPYTEIRKNDDDFRARRITAYLDLMAEIIDRKFTEICAEPFEAGRSITRYFELLPDNSPLRQRYLAMCETSDEARRRMLQDELRSDMVKGDIDVNIMSKVDKLNKDAFGVALPDRYSDASASLRGFAHSRLTSSVILSAGMNPRLYNYLENFPDFFPGEDGKFSKKITLKVSDFRSALIQAKFLAKKGIWVSEFRIESGLNCGGHAFATDGYLLGPILEEFKNRRGELIRELFQLLRPALQNRGINLSTAPPLKVTVQGGIGTTQEDRFLLKHYEVDATGWGSPFLMVPEATNVDESTLDDLIHAQPSDYYVSNSSPLGVLFNNFRKSSAEKQRLERIAKGRPGSPCKKKYLVSNTEFTEEPICTASRVYQHLKIKQLNSADLSEEEREKSINAVTEKLCLCEGLSAAALLKNGLLSPRENKAVAICPGPNLAWFSGKYTLEEMIGHIYGRINLIARDNRPHMFINELTLYVTHYRKNLEEQLENFSDKKQKYLGKFRDQLLEGVSYYKALIPQITNQATHYLQEMQEQLAALEETILSMQSPSPAAEMVNR